MMIDLTGSEKTALTTFVERGMPKTARHRAN
jgi:hypothetical protein